MNLKLKSLLEKIPFHSRLKTIAARGFFNDRNDTLIYIHIGKCGGVSLLEAVKKSPIVTNQFKKVTRVHVSKPPIFKKSKYLIVIRNPISRAVSAFNWRYDLVVESGKQRNRFPDEFEILNKYKTLNNMSEKLYTDGILNHSTARDFRKIHHLKEDISYYIGDLLDRLRPDQVFCVLSTETLDEDVKNLLGVSKVARTHEHSSVVSPDRKRLSEVARANLKRFLQNDYRSIEKLLEIKNSTAAQEITLLK